MCLAIYTLAAGEKAQVSFAFERIFHRRDGTTNILLDAAIQNCCTVPIKEMSIVMPYRFVDVGEVTTRIKQLAGDLESVRPSLKAWRKEELKQFQLHTEKLRQLSHPSHWPYTGTIKNLRLTPRGDGRFVVATGGGRIVDGAIKTGWELQQPRRVGDMMWLLACLGRMTVIDYRLAPGNGPKEELQPGEKMWIRLECDIPAMGFNRKAGWRRWMPTNTYHQTFYSSQAVDGLVRHQADAFDFLARGHLHPALTLDVENEMLGAMPLKIIPPAECLLREEDWRAFFYREYGLTVIEQEFPKHIPARPTAAGEYVLPESAFPKHSKLGFWPRSLIKWLPSKGARFLLCEQFYVGPIHGKPTSGEEEYVTRVVIKKENHLYAAMAATGPVSLLLSLIGCC